MNVPESAARIKVGEASCQRQAMIQTDTPMAKLPAKVARRAGRRMKTMSVAAIIQVNKEGSMIQTLAHVLASMISGISAGAAQNLRRA